jgi:hypothetical protein
MRRALLIGSQTGGLTGVHNDVEAMAAALSSLGFSVRKAIEADATYDGMLDCYRSLVQETRDGDAAVVYYSGHGGRERNALAREDPSLPPWLQYLVPTDIDDRSDSRFRGLLAQELSLLQLELTDKTPNVTTILDCCHSARMSRAPSMLPKANNQLSGFPWEEVARRWRAARDDARASSADSNQLAVRVVACSPDQSAYELADTELGGPHGALTAALVPVLTSSDTGSYTWRDVLDVLRPRIMDAVPQQRPEVAGDIRRHVFSTERRDETGVLPIRIEDGVALLDDVSLFGLVEGDTYAIAAPGADTPLATAAIDAICGGRARLKVEGMAIDALPTGATAHPLEVALGARPVAVTPPNDSRRAEIVDALRRSPHIRVAESAVGALATISLADDGLQVLDAAGEPLYDVAKPVTADGLANLERDLGLLARATHLRELSSGEGDAALSEDVGVTYARLLPDGVERAVATSGEHIFSGDRLVVRIENRANETRYASVLDIGIAGAISIQTTSEPEGITLARSERYEVGRDSLGALKGLELFWPPAVPSSAPRAETFITIVSDSKITGLGSLEQAGIESRTARRGQGSNLERLIDEVAAGRRDSRPAPGDATRVRYRVHRFDFVLHPEVRAGEADEPSFELDERPDPSFRLVVPRGVEPPRNVAVRIKELTVHSNRSLLASAVRIDAMVVTAPEQGSTAPYRAATARFDRVKDGDRLPFDDLLIYDGPVGRFVDLAVWVSRDSHPDTVLGDLLAKETSSEEMKGAVAVLAALAVSAPQAAVVAASVAAVATLVRTGARLLDALEGKSIGVYRTSLLPHQRFGAGDETSPSGRHPAQGLLRAQDLSFAYEVIDLDAS